MADGTWKGWTWTVFGNSTAVANNTIKENSDGSVTLESSGNKGKIAKDHEGIDFLYYKIEKILVIESSEESIVKLKFDLAGQNTDPHKSDFLICGDSSSGSPCF